MNLCGLKNPTKTQNKTKPNQLQYQKSEMSNPLSNAWASKTAPGDVSPFSRRVLAQMPSGPSSTASRRRVPHRCQVTGRRKNSCCGTGSKAPLPAPLLEPGNRCCGVPPSRGQVTSYRNNPRQPSLWGGTACTHTRYRTGEFLSDSSQPLLIARSPKQVDRNSNQQFKYKQS